jgi:hypothetical protein
MLPALIDKIDDRDNGHHAQNADEQHDYQFTQLAR